MGTLTHPRDIRVFPRATIATSVSGSVSVDFESATFDFGGESIPSAGRTLGSTDSHRGFAGVLSSRSCAGRRCRITSRRNERPASPPLRRSPPPFPSDTVDGDDGRFRSNVRRDAAEDDSTMLERGESAVVADANPSVATLGRLRRRARSARRGRSSGTTIATGTSATASTTFADWTRERAVRRPPVPPARPAERISRRSRRSRPIRRRTRRRASRGVRL
ncbi:hypothetical protein EA472_17030 [Natrarchaeobius oligotrophus]|uniref:Uncharacterized protein n=1 Tax=Natrarchaeobius chitinivorans TaxID=1679083 RepID=A0A3N6NHV2_NATCH|nr:hypothetical protein EA472_17030 [Natrarchaeobius chitinivorans]